MKDEDETAWIRQTFALCEGPEVGYRASLRRLSSDGQTFVDYEHSIRYTRAALTMPQ